MDKQKLAKQLSVFILCVFLGFVMSVQYNSVKLRSSSAGTMRNDELQSLLTEEKNKTAALQEQINQMQSTIDNYRDSIEHSGSVYKGIETDLANAEMLAGITDVSGSGIVIKLEDAKVIDTSVSPENFIVHDYDLRNVVNELRAAGAEAISINGERITAATAIRCVGPVIMVNNVRQSSPFEIKAIGNPETLETSLSMTGGILSELKLWVGVNIQKQDKIEVKAYSGATTFNYAVPSKKTENQ